MNVLPAQSQQSLPPLSELEAVLLLFTGEKAISFSEVRKCSWLWNKISGFGKVLSFFFSGKQFWKRQFLSQLLIEVSLLYMEEMKSGSFKRHDERVLSRLRSFLHMDADIEARVRQQTSPEVLQFLSEKPPTFHERKELFRKECRERGLNQEQCIWYSHETYAQYTARMQEKIRSFVTEKEKQEPLSPAVEQEEKAHGWKMSVEMKKSILQLKKKITELLGQGELFLKQMVLLRQKCFFVRLEDEKLFQEARVLEDRVVQVVLVLEKISSEIPEEPLFPFFESEKRVKDSLLQKEHAVKEPEKEIETIESAMHSVEESLIRLKKKIHRILQALSKKVAQIEVLERSSRYYTSQMRLISQSNDTLEEYKKSLTKTPGILFPVRLLESYIENSVALCASFFQAESGIYQNSFKNRFDT